MEGAFERPDGFDLEFEAMIARTHAATDFDAALALVKSAFERARQIIDTQTDEQLMTPLPRRADYVWGSAAGCGFWHR